jgi:hypothetical protein
VPFDEFLAEVKQEEAPLKAYVEEQKAELAEMKQAAEERKAPAKYGGSCVLIPLAKTAGIMAVLIGAVYTGYDIHSNGFTASWIGGVVRFIFKPMFKQCYGEGYNKGWKEGNEPKAESDTTYYYNMGYERGGKDEAADIGTYHQAEQFEKAAYENGYNAARSKYENKNAPQGVYVNPADIPAGKENVVKKLQNVIITYQAQLADLQKKLCRDYDGGGSK